MGNVWPGDLFLLRSTMWTAKGVKKFGEEDIKPIHKVIPVGDDDRYSVVIRNEIW